MLTNSLGWNKLKIGLLRITARPGDRRTNNLFLIEAFYMKESDKEKKQVEKKLQEAEVQQAEIQRAFNVAMAKGTHGLIEMVERGRKRGLIISLIDRIDSFCLMYAAYSDTLKNYPDFLSKFQLTDSNQRDLIQSLTDFLHTFIDTYKSIRKDIKSNLEIKDLEELFPERPTYFETLNQGMQTTTGLVEQLAQFKAYLQRYLF